MGQQWSAQRHDVDLNFIEGIEKPVRSRFEESLKFTILEEQSHFVTVNFIAFDTEHDNLLREHPWTENSALTIEQRQKI